MQELKINIFDAKLSKMYQNVRFLGYQQKNQNISNKSIKNFFKRNSAVNRLKLK